MKAHRAGWRPLRREQLMSEPRHDPYELRGKLAEPTRCLGCGAVFQRGRWTWAFAEREVAETLCPACRRITDDFPAGIVMLSGKFVASHLDELEERVRNVESREKAKHPLERVMSIGRVSKGMRATTTSIHLARAIGEAVEDAYDGDLDFHYNEAESQLRVQWTRD